MWPAMNSSTKVQMIVECDMRKASRSLMSCWCCSGVIQTLTAWFAPRSAGWEVFLVGTGHPQIANRMVPVGRLAAAALYSRPGGKACFS